MNWDAIGAIGEIIGALAVIATLMYLAIQVRHTKNMVTNQNEQTLYQQWASSLQPLATSPQVSSLMVKGRKSYLGLTEEERMQFDALMVMVLNSAEAPYRITDNSEEDAEVEVIWEIARLFLNYPGGREYWEQNKSGFYPDFVTWIDAKIDSDKEFAARESTSC
jgi:hypothetical protein